MTSLASRYRGGIVDVILEEEISEDDSDFIAQEARIEAEEQQHFNGSRPRCEGEESMQQQSDAYGEAMAILAQCDQEFANELNQTVILKNVDKNEVDIPLPSPPAAHSGRLDPR